MMLSLTDPELVSALVVADIAQIQHVTHSHWPYIPAMRDLDLRHIARRSDADPLLTDAIHDDTLRGFLLHNLSVEGGQASWRINLAVLEANMETLVDFQIDLPEVSFEGRAFFPYDGASPYVPPETHPRIRVYFPDAEIDALPGSGHWLHAEQPDVFVARIEAWLSTAGGS